MNMIPTVCSKPLATVCPKPLTTVSGKRLPRIKTDTVRRSTGTEKTRPVVKAAYSLKDAERDLLDFCVALKTDNGIYDGVRCRIANTPVGLCVGDILMGSTCLMNGDGTFDYYSMIEGLPYILKVKSATGEPGSILTVREGDNLLLTDIRSQVRISRLRPDWLVSAMRVYAVIDKYRSILLWEMESRFFKVSSFPMIPGDNFSDEYEEVEA